MQAHPCSQRRKAQRQEVQTALGSEDGYKWEQKRPICTAE